MTTWSDELYRNLQTEFAPHADFVRASAMAAYMKDNFVFLGVSAVPRRAAMKKALATVATPTEADLLAFANRCWDTPEREYHYVAVDILAKHVKRLSSDALGPIRVLVETNSWWDSIDGLAANVVGPLVKTNPELLQQMDEWVQDPNFWVARIAILHQLHYGSATDLDRLFRYALARASDKEFFIRKAIGWALREYAWTDPETIRDFVSEHSDVLSPLTVREATKNIDKILAKRAAAQ